LYLVQRGRPGLITWGDQRAKKKAEKGKTCWRRVELLAVTRSEGERWKVEGGRWKVEVGVGCRFVVMVVDMGYKDMVVVVACDSSVAVSVVIMVVRVGLGLGLGVY
jgi:hypothetical protein